MNKGNGILCIRGGKIIAQLLKAAMREKLSPRWNREKAKQKQQSKVQKQQDDKAKDKSLSWKTNHGEADAAECTAFQY